MARIRCVKFGVATGAKQAEGQGGDKEATG